MSEDEVIHLLVGEEAEWYDRGMIAYEMGFNANHNPYERGTIQAAYWKRGWTDCMEEE